jgi:hypothetical protein
MKNPSKLLTEMPCWFSALAVLTLDATIGYVDYLTSDYSMLIFYAIPIALAAWFQGICFAVVVSLTAGGTRFLSDYFCYSNGNVRYLTSMEDLLYLLIVALLCSALKRFSDERQLANRDEPVGEILKAEP